MDDVYLEKTKLAEDWENLVKERIEFELERRNFIEEKKKFDQMIINDEVFIYLPCHGYLFICFVS
jgi:hypothetical protein